LSVSLFEKFPAILQPSRLNLAKGETLFTQGSLIENLYLIDSGRIKLQRNTIDGSSVILHTGEAGETIAEASLFAENYHCTAIADTETHVSFVKKHALLRHLEENPQEMKSLLERFARQVRDLRAINEIKNIRSAQERILVYIKSNINSNSEMALDISMKDLAHKIGLAHETFYREIKKLEKSGVIKREQSYLKLI